MNINKGKNKRAVILFLGKENLSNKKKFHSPHIYHLLNKQIYNVITEAKNNIEFETILCSEFASEGPYDLFIKQNGYNFGNRFNNAIEKTFQLGFDQIIIVGNDSPDLIHSDILNSFENLADGKIVIGPSYDGGFYLLGLNKENYNQKITARWNSEYVMEDLLSQVDFNNTYLLETLFDIDNESDLLNWFNIGSRNAKLFYKYLNFIQKSKLKRIHIILNLSSEQNKYRIHTQKSPPLFSFSLN